MTETYYKIQNITNNLFLYAEGNSLEKAILILPAKFLALLGQFFKNKNQKLSRSLRIDRKFLISLNAYQGISPYLKEKRRLLLRVFFTKFCSIIKTLEGPR